MRHSRIGGKLEVPYLCSRDAERAKVGSAVLYVYTVVAVAQQRVIIGTCQQVYRIAGNFGRCKFSHK